MANKAVNNNNLENIITVTDCCQGRHGPVHGIVLLFCSKDAADVAPDVVAAQETFSIKFKTSCGSHYTRWPNKNSNEIAPRIWRSAHREGGVVGVVDLCIVIEGVIHINFANRWRTKL